MPLNRHAPCTALRCCSLKATFEYSCLLAESVAVDPDGKLHMLDRYGSVLRAEADGKLERIAHLGAGRPLGNHFDASGNLFICNAGPVSC